jgi:hypothetical protein
MNNIEVSDKCLETVEPFPCPFGSQRPFSQFRQRHEGDARFMIFQMAPVLACQSVLLPLVRDDIGVHDPIGHGLSSMPSFAQPILKIFELLVTSKKTPALLLDPFQIMSRPRCALSLELFQSHLAWHALDGHIDYRVIRFPIFLGHRQLQFVETPTSLSLPPYQTSASSTIDSIRPLTLVPPSAVILRI